ncbi:MAG TPA: hypothetical protein PLO37_26300 [Candidatus Hydrogenedentes bacterium]|nr:hypothetical protein [Candidatus Hydrogenedentota bacterium]
MQHTAKRGLTPSESPRRAVCPRFPDLPDLLAVLSPDKVSVFEPLEASGEVPEDMWDSHSFVAARLRHAIRFRG